LNIYFVFIQKISIKGIILAQLYSGIVLLLLLLPVIRNNYIFRIDKKILKIVIKFSIPLLIANLCMAGSNVADRFILNIYSGSEQVGLYSFAYRIALIMSILMASFTNAWGPHSLNMYYSSEYKTSFGIILNKLIAVSGLLLLVVSLLAKYLFDLQIFGIHFFNPDYRAGIIIIPIVMTGYFFNGLSSYYSVYPSVYNKSFHFMISEFLALSINIIFNIILIPWFGIMGAASATTAGFTFGAAYLWIISGNKIKIQYRINELLIIVLSAIIFIVIGMVMNILLIDAILIVSYLLILQYFTKIKVIHLFRFS
jgi:O-antigen/teichoic acid export membrane protein